jgi:L,D-peptidoglycan transpeptidase YkuD (ErfK/YbiS/YcfS/YnhG family)
MVRGPLDVTLGRKGLAWGQGEHRSNAPPGFPLKREGDGCSPAGVFRIPFAFGLVNEAEAARLRLPYLKLTQDIIGVDDPNSRFYNQVVNATEVRRDWESNEAMSRHTKLYRWGAFIDQNPGRIPGGGSCIFLHLWPGPGRSTAGCTAMAERDLKEVLEWLDPAKEPRLVQTLTAW